MSKLQVFDSELSSSDTSLLGIHRISKQFPILANASAVAFCEEAARHLKDTLSTMAPKPQENQPLPQKIHLKASLRRCFLGLPLSAGCESGDQLSIDAIAGAPTVKGDTKESQALADIDAHAPLKLPRLLEAFYETLHIPNLAPLLNLQWLQTTRSGAAQVQFGPTAFDGSEAVAVNTIQRVLSGPLQVLPWVPIPADTAAPSDLPTSITLALQALQPFLHTGTLSPLRVLREAQEAFHPSAITFDAKEVMERCGCLHDKAMSEEEVMDFESPDRASQQDLLRRFLHVEAGAAVEVERLKGRLLAVVIRNSNGEEKRRVLCGSPSLPYQVMNNSIGPPVLPSFTHAHPLCVALSFPTSAIFGLPWCCTTYF